MLLIHKLHIFIKRGFNVIFQSGFTEAISLLHVNLPGAIYYINNVED